MRKIYSTGIFIFCTLHIFAQSITWTTQASDISGGSQSISDLSVINKTTAWAIAAVFDGPFCGTTNTKFTRTTDGETWNSGTISLPAGYTTTCISAIDSNTAWVSALKLYTYNDGRIYKTTDGGETWSYQSSADFVEAATFVHFFNADEGVAMGTQEIFITSDGGETWTDNSYVPYPWAPTYYPTGFWYNAYEVLGSIIWLGDAWGNMYRSDDKGVTWNLITEYFGSDANFACKGIAFKDQNNGLAIGAYYSGSETGGYSDDGNILKTTDGGFTWTPVYIYPMEGYVNWGYLNYSLKYDIAYVPGTEGSFILSGEGFPAFSAITKDFATTWTAIDTSTGHTCITCLDSAFCWSGGNILSADNGIFKFGASPDDTSDVDTTLMAIDLKNNLQFICYPNPASDVFAY